eukprot:TRINITY_DN765_c0_g1_i3.p1 TRINITY_DN765_c0_g1~~TRINITY_DN765_c0_g1_i3.p1  ORF type:complete len:266 (+),score=89.01 TRINITY_DN765_c0_g1_i3:397-1194(+)
MTSAMTVSAPAAKKMPLGVCVDNRANVQQPAKQRRPVPDLNLSLTRSESVRTDQSTHRRSEGHLRTSRSRRSMLGRMSLIPAEQLSDIEIPTEGTPEHEAVMHKIAQREKQLALGRSTSGYANYRRSVPVRDPSNSEHINTPRAAWNISKRQFDLHIRQWRRDLHYWDTTEETCERDLSFDLSSDCITDEQHTPNNSITVDEPLPDLVPMTESDLGSVEIPVSPDVNDALDIDLSGISLTLGDEEEEVKPYGEEELEYFLSAYSW